MPTYLGGNKNTKEAQPASILKSGSSLSKRKSPLTREAAMVEATAGTPTDRGNKAARPQGTSPMTRVVGKDDEVDVQSPEVMGLTLKRSPHPRTTTTTASRGRYPVRGRSCLRPPLVRNPHVPTDHGSQSSPGTHQHRTRKQVGVPPLLLKRYSTSGPPPSRTGTRLPRRQTNVWCACVSSCSPAMSKRPF